MYGVDISSAAHTGVELLYGIAVGHVVAAETLPEAGKLTCMPCIPEPE